MDESPMASARMRPNEFGQHDQRDTVRMRHPGRSRVRRLGAYVRQDLTRRRDHSREPQNQASDWGAFRAIEMSIEALLPGRTRVSGRRFGVTLLPYLAPRQPVRGTLRRRHLPDDGSSRGTTADDLFVRVHTGPAGGAVLRRGRNGKPWSPCTLAPPRWRRAAGSGPAPSEQRPAAPAPARPATPPAARPAAPAPAKPAAPAAQQQAPAAQQPPRRSGPAGARTEPSADDLFAVGQVLL